VVRRRLLTLLGIAGILFALFLTHSIWMGWMGVCLVRDTAPVHADIAVVLGGDSYGHRILRAADLAKQGFVPKVLVSGAPGFYDMHECDLSIPFAIKRGYAPEWFIAFPHEGHSTEEEAEAIVKELQKRNVHKLILVTSDFHSRRALRTFQKRAPDIEMSVVAARDEFFNARGWWHTREGRKTFLLEWVKTFANLVGM
jgi:uncharacterized SAM-binding protein YcdF (DUF218 family)